MPTNLLKYVLCGSAAFALFALSSVHPFGTPKQTERKGIHTNFLHPSAEAAAVLDRSCADCHSNKTIWPWYSYVAPMSWLVERDVRRGRDSLNLSLWDLYSLNQRQKLLADIATAVHNKEMPLPQYTLIHRRALLSEKDVQLVYEWVRSERRRASSEK